MKSRRWHRWALLLIAVGCAHQPRESSPAGPTSKQFGCFEVALLRPLRTPFPIPKRLELRSERSQCTFAANDLVALADDDASRGEAHGHWWLEKDGHIHVAWGGDFYGVAFTLLESAGQVRGTAVTFQDVGQRSDSTVASLRRTACTPSRVVAQAKADHASTFAASSPDRAVSASNRFGFDLYARVKQGGGNLICSPVSASIALTMTAAGARGKTLTEMSSVLHLGSNHLPELHASFGDLVDSLNEIDGNVQLQIADRLWGQKDASFKPDFLTLLEQRYRAPVAQVDFTHDAESARVAINHWAALRTHDRIPEFLPPGSIDAGTRLVLINALYFKGLWRSPFRPKATTDLPFSTSTRQLTARMMTKTLDLLHATVPGAALVELPYEGGQSMVVILPDAVDGLDEIETRIATSYPLWLAALRRKRVDLRLPRWRASSDLPLNAALAAMGMPSAFATAADFTGMADLKPLFIHAVLQRAFIEVDESGTEAAGLTTDSSAGAWAPKKIEQVVFHADHPFMYVIRDTKTGAILFMGRVVEPRT